MYINKISFSLICQLRTETENGFPGEGTFPIFKLQLWDYHARKSISKRNGEII